MSQGKTLKELEANLKEAYLLMAMDDVSGRAQGEDDADPMKENWTLVTIDQAALFPRIGSEYHESQINPRAQKKQVVQAQRAPPATIGTSWWGIAALDATYSCFGDETKSPRFPAPFTSLFLSKIKLSRR